MPTILLISNPRIMALGAARALLQSQQVQLMSEAVRTLDSLSEIDAILERLKALPQYDGQLEEPRNRQERRAQRFGHPQPKWGVPPWKGNQ